MTDLVIQDCYNWIKAAVICGAMLLAGLSVSSCGFAAGPVSMGTPSWQKLINEDRETARQIDLELAKLEARKK